LRHQTGGNSSIYISTSTSQEVAESFAKRQGSGSYIYEIDPKGLHGIDINSSLGSASKYPHEAEIAVVSKIPSRNIIGARPINADGSIGKFYSNPNYIPK
jgi:complete genome; segment 11/17